MSLCARCGLQISGDSELCAHHTVADGEGWGQSNRVLCAFIHRGVALSRLSEKDRADDLLVVNMSDES